MILLYMIYWKKHKTKNKKIKKKNIKKKFKKIKKGQNIWAHPHFECG